MPSPLVSVVMSCYNSEKYLADAIDSIVEQTYTNIEFIIVDDGSTDNTLNIIQSYNDKRIKLIARENKGLVYSLNEAIELCAGSYIARMDADDICRPDRLAKQVDYMERNTQISACGGAIHHFNEKGSIKTQSRPTEHSDLVFCSLHRSPIAHPAAIIRKSVLDQYNLRYNNNYKYGQDIKLWFDIIKVGKLSNLTDVVIDYRISEDQVTSSRRAEQKKLASEARAEGYRYIVTNFKPYSRLHWYFLLKYETKYVKEKNINFLIKRIVVAPLSPKEKIELLFYTLLRK